MGEIGVNGDAHPAADSQKVAKNLPVSFYSPMPGFKSALIPLKYESHYNKYTYSTFSWNITEHTLMRHLLFV